MATLTYNTLEHVATEARPYPTYLLEDAKTGLCLFSAAFYGHNEAIHFALEEVETTCVDIDQEKLHVMQGIYPEDWTFICVDAWDYAAMCQVKEHRFDIVSVDTFRGWATEKSLKTLELWCSIANAAVIATIEDSQLESYEVPEGWTDSHFRRNSTVFWLVLTRA